MTVGKIIALITEMKIILLSLFVPFLSACQENGFDFQHVQLPADSSLISKYKLEKRNQLNEFTEYLSNSKTIMRYKNESLYGSMDDDPDNEYGFSNHAIFYFTPENDKIGAYTIHTETQEKTELLQKIVNEQFGETDYHYQNEDFTYRVWLKDSSYYFFSTNSTIVNFGESTVTGELTVISGKSPVFMEWFTSGGQFSYYGNYLKEKSKPELRNGNFTYKDFIREEDNPWMKDAYLKDYIPKL